MPVIQAKNAPVFDKFGIFVTGLAAPSRGARETNVWRLRLPASEPAAPHAVDREEIFVGLSGRALAEIAGEEHELGAGDTLIVPPNVTFSIRALGAQDFEAMVIAPVGVHAILPSGERFAPPWTE
jgi:mannose-6-phosphate isomerase-like protein (cupin superfamily)